MGFDCKRIAAPLWSVPVVSACSMMIVVCIDMALCYVQLYVCTVCYVLEYPHTTSQKTNSHLLFNVQHDSLAGLRTFHRSSVLSSVRSRSLLRRLPLRPNSPPHYNRTTTTAYYDNRVCRSDCSDRSFTTPFFTDRSYPSFSLTTHLPNTYRTISMPWGAPGGDPLALTAPVPSPTKQQSWQRSAGWRHDP